MSEFINKIIKNITNKENISAFDDIERDELPVNEINISINPKNSTKHNNSYDKSNIETVDVTPKIIVSSGSKTPNVDIKVEKLSNNVEGIKIPNSVKQTGISLNSTEGYNERIWSDGTNQRKLSELWKSKGSTSNNGIATLDSRYLVAVTPTFGSVGDKIDVKLDDGTIIPCVIADLKDSSDKLYTEYGHKLELPSGNMGVDIIEWEAFETKDKIDLGLWHNKYVDSIINISKNS